MPAAGWSQRIYSALYLMHGAWISVYFADSCRATSSRRCALNSEGGSLLVLADPVSECSLECASLRDGALVTGWLRLAVGAIERQERGGGG